MIDVYLILQWKTNGRPQSPLCKRVQMPCLPPVGAKIWLDDYDKDELILEFLDLRVEDIEWWEDCPGRFDVVLSELDLGAVDDFEWQFDGLVRLGWSNIALKYADKR